MINSFVVCVDNQGYEVSLVVRRIYERIADSSAADQGLYRVVDETGDDYLYPAAMFEEIELPSLVRNKLRFSA